MLTDDRDSGSLSVLIIGYAAITVVLVIVGIDVSKLFLAQRALSSAADAAALTAVQGVALHQVYDGDGVHCGTPIPLSSGQAAAMAARSLDRSRPDLRHVFTSVDQPETAVAGGAVSVRLSGVVTVPFGRVIGWLAPGHADGQFRVSETSRATSPVAGAAC